MAGQRIIAQNPLSRVRIANRGIATPLSTWLLGTSGLSTGASGVNVGDVTWAFALPNVAGQTYQDVTVAPGAPLTVPPYGALLAVQGSQFGRPPFPQHASLSTSVVTNSTVIWNGSLYMASNFIAKRPNALAAFTTLPAISPAVMQHLNVSYPTGLYLVVGGSSNPNTFLSVISSDTVKSAQVQIDGSGFFPNNHTALEGIGAGVIIVLMLTAGPVYRTANTGASWTQISGNLSNPAVRVWIAAFKSGGTLWMLGAQGVFASSVDDGLNWTVNTSIPNAGPGFHQPVSSNAPYTSTCFDKRPGFAKGYGLCTDGSVRSWDLNNPAAGFTTEAPAGAFGVLTPRFVSTSIGLICSNNLGVQFMPWSRLGLGLGAVLMVTEAVLKAAPLYVTNTANWPDTMACWGLELGDGTLTFDSLQNLNIKVSFTMIDGVASFDRFVMADPNLTSGRKPYVRVL